MHNSRVGIGIALTSLVCSSALLPGTAYAALSINLVFPDGTTSMAINPTNAGQDYPILVYGTVTGVNPVSSTNYDGLQFAYYNVVSSIGLGGGLMGNMDSAGNYASALNGVVPSNGGNENGFRGNGSQPGNVQDINSDGIADLGGTTLLQYAKPRSTQIIWDSDDSSAFGAPNPTGAADIIIGGADDNSVSFLMETIYFKVGSSPLIGQSTSFNPVIPTIAMPYTESIFVMDSPTNADGPGAEAGYVYSTASAGTSVQFTVTPVPEPATAITACLLGGMALPRRRRGKKAFEHSSA